MTKPSIIQGRFAGWEINPELQDEGFAEDEKKKGSGEIVKNPELFLKIAFHTLQWLPFSAVPATPCLWKCIVQKNCTPIRKYYASVV